jgi:hypothetical protein
LKLIDLTCPSNCTAITDSQKQITEVELPKQVAIVFTHYPEDMWSRIRDAFAKLISSTREKLDAALAGSF